MPTDRRNKLIPLMGSWVIGLFIRKQGGFILVEVLVAFTILAVALVPLFQSFSAAGGLNAGAKSFGEVLSLAQSKLEEIQDGPYAAVVASPEKAFGEETLYAAYPGILYKLDVTEDNPVRKIVQVRVYYYDAAGNRKEVTLTGVAARR